jgi:hypothetical protein
MYFSTIFNDKRFTACLLCVWLGVILVLFADMGVLSSNFFSIGPSKTLRFMSVSIDTTQKWLMLAAFCLIDTMIKTFGHDSIIIWSVHTLCDPKCSALPYPRWMCLMIMELYYLYVHVSGVFKFFISLSQIDFVIIMSASDLVMKGFTYSSYMHGKSYARPAQAPTALVTEEEQLMLEKA